MIATLGPPLVGTSSNARAEFAYTPRGIGGGGAMASYSISPYANLRFVGTDMGTLFYSEDTGRSWTPVDQRQITYSSDLAHASDVGFSADGKTVFFASGGRSPMRSLDRGVHWDEINIDLGKSEHISYWVSDREDPNILYCATDQGLLLTRDKGENWTRFTEISGRSTGTALLRHGGHPVVFHATDAQIYRAAGVGKSFEPWYTPHATAIRSFTGGADGSGLTLAFIDTQGESACSWAKGNADTIADCGFVWVADQEESDSPQFLRTHQEAGRFLRMAENDSSTIWATGGEWMNQFGSRTWVTHDRGLSWKLKFLVYDWEQRPFQPWPRGRLEYSAVGLDVGWDDNAYHSFAINPQNSSEVGGSGNYFLHTTRDGGETWQAPFTRFADSGLREKGKKWASTGLEVTSVLKLKFHPRNPRIGYAAMADLGGIVTEDGGDTWRICRTQYNTNYDYAFDPLHTDWVYAAAGNFHDFPLNQKAPVVMRGGIFLSKDRGHNWQRVTPDNAQWNRQFLSVAYDPVKRVLYAGTQGGGIGRSLDGGAHWEFINEGLPPGDAIVPQIETDPRFGNVYLLLTGNAPGFINHASTGIYFLNASFRNPHWNLLRGQVEHPNGVDPKYEMWLFPTAFAVDFSRTGRDVLWLSDMEVKRQYLASGIWKSEDGGKNWERSLQFTHPLSLTLDPRNSRRVYATGLYALDGQWGNGGAMYTNDGGQNWDKNEGMPFATNPDGAVPDPASPGSIFYLFFGDGILYGPKPH